MTDKRKEWGQWAKLAVGQLKPLRTLEEWAAWIVANGNNLGECSQINPPAYLDVKTAIEVQSLRIDKWTSALSNAASTKTLTPPTPSENSFIPTPPLTP